MAEGQSADGWAEDGQAGGNRADGSQVGAPLLRQRMRRLSETCFHDREFFLRSQDRVHYLKISARAQKWMAGVALGALCWVGYSTLAFFLSGYLVDAKDRQITQQRAAYIDLLAEVSGYQAQFAQIANDVQAAQDDLLSLVDGGGAAEPPAGLAVRLSSAETAQMRATVARGLLSERLRGLESELLKIAGRNGDLSSRIGALQEALQTTAAEREAIAAARETLDRRLEETQQALALSLDERSALERRLQALEAELAARESAHAAEAARLESAQAALAESTAQEIAGLEAERDALRERVAGLEDLGATAELREQELAGQITTLQAAVSQILGRNTQLAGERSRLQLQLASMEALIADMRDQQKEIVDRVDHQTANSIEGLEEIIARTGLDSDALLASAQVAVGGQGGPFIPADDLLATDASYELQVSVAMLDQRLDRLEQLARVLEALPLAVPLEHYEINSEFGYRKDPINGRSALHSGLDFGAPRNTPLYTTAPGVVTFAGWRGRYGRTVEIDHGYGVKTRFAHMSQISVKKGQTVVLGDEVGLLGSSGRVTGPHLHYEILFEGKPYDPMNFIEAGKDVF